MIMIPCVGDRHSECKSPYCACSCHDGWMDDRHTHYRFGGGWYLVTEESDKYYHAVVMGLGASGRTPAEAIQNAARRHQPQPATAEELDEAQLIRRNIKQGGLKC